MPGVYHRSGLVLFSRVPNNTDLVHNTIGLKELAKVMACGGERQIANINIHERFLVGNGANDRQVIRTVCRSKQCKSIMQEKRREWPSDHKICLMIPQDIEILYNKIIHMTSGSSLFSQKTLGNTGQRKKYVPLRSREGKAKILPRTWLLLRQRSMESCARNTSLGDWRVEIGLPTVSDLYKP